MRAAAGARAAAVTVAVAAAALGVGACEPSPETISREDFVGTYVALRIAELQRADLVIEEEARDSVLAARGVTEADLDAFVEANGRDVVFMQSVWTEVDSIMRARSEGADPGR